MGGYGCGRLSESRAAIESRLVANRPIARRRNIGTPPRIPRRAGLNRVLHYSSPRPRSSRREHFPGTSARDRGAWRPRTRSSSGRWRSLPSLFRKTLAIGSSFLGVLVPPSPEAAALVRLGGCLLRAHRRRWNRARPRTRARLPTIYWFFGTAIVLAGYAVTHSPSDPKFSAACSNEWWRSRSSSTSS